MQRQGDIAVIGLAVMGQNLILNMNDHGFTVVAFNRTASKVDQFLKTAAKGTGIIGAHSIEEMMRILKCPRKVMLMIKAGSPVDEAIEQILPFCEKGDCIIDGGNSHFTDTIRRTRLLGEKGILFIGTGISGGEEGARRGPSIMPGGVATAWPLVKDIFTAIAAKTPDGDPCCDWVGNDGAGHYVKMVHNGIEYGDMQVIGEVYQLMRHGLGLSADAIAKIFTAWNATELNSYLIEITADILKFKEPDGVPLVDRIVDRAGQKGTGKWFIVNSLDLGMPVTLIAESVYARCLSALKEERVEASKLISGPGATFTGDITACVEDIRGALLASKIVSYAQGFMCMREAAKVYGWKLDFGTIAMLWRSGCIIRSVFLDKIKAAFGAKPELSSLLLDDYFRGIMARYQGSWRRVVSLAATIGVPLPAFSSALAFFDGYRCERLPANLLQAQRDYFGAHTYERLDQPVGKFFHSNWTGRGGNVSSGTYEA